MVCTPNALDFITPLTLSTLSKKSVFSNFFIEETGEWVNHVELGKWADAMIIAPATANSISKMTTGRCDNILIATYLSTSCPVFFAPAMDLDMYQHPSTSTNISQLINFGNIELPATSGELASGLVGMGRMCEPEDVVEIVKDYFEFSNTLAGKKILVNAGPTHEKIDPVRFIGNYSSGKMGKAIANTLAERGANVELVLGPINTQGLSPKINITSIISAQDMYEACHAIFPSCDAGILAAAVADFTPSKFSNQKIKKGDHDGFQLSMSRTRDVLASLGESKTEQQVLVGFALETHDELNHAQKKLDKKNLDFIVLNSMKDKGAGFAKNTNKVTIIEKNGKTHNFDTKSKKEVSKDIINLLHNYL